MDFFTGDISNLVFKRNVKADLGEVSLDSQMLKVLMELDGEKKLSDVAKILNIKMNSLREILFRLNKLGLFESLDNLSPKLGNDFIDEIITRLSKAMGPVAKIIVEDEIEDMGYNTDSVPENKAAELVDRLARQIPREEKRVRFQKSMLSKL